MREEGAHAGAPLRSPHAAPSTQSRRAGFPTRPPARIDWRLLPFLPVPCSYAKLAGLPQRECCNRACPSRHVSSQPLQALTAAPLPLFYPPAEYGLYGAFVPCIAYALLGSSRQLAVGPVAVTSIMLANGKFCANHAFQIQDADCIGSFTFASGLEDIIGANDDPNNPADPELQERYNRAAIQVRLPGRPACFACCGSVQPCCCAVCAAH